MASQGFESLSFCQMKDKLLSASVATESKLEQIILLLEDDSLSDLERKLLNKEFIMLSKMLVDLLEKN